MLTERMRAIFDEVSRLPEEEQNILVELFRQAILAERMDEELINESKDLLRMMTEEAMEDIERGTQYPPVP